MYRKYKETMHFVHNIFYIILTMLFCLEQLGTENHNITIETHFYETEELTIDDEEITRRVAYGVKASLGEVPFLVSFKSGRWLRGVFRGSVICGGTLVKPDKILTAAHCFIMTRRSCGMVTHSDAYLNIVFAVMGQLTNRATYSPEKKNDGQWRILKNLTYHSRYAFPRNDIAILFTTNPFDINEHVATINFAREHKDYIGYCTIAGFGRTENNMRSPDLLLGAVEVISTYDCQRRIGRRDRLLRSPKIICSTLSSSNTGKGDSGGPLFCRSTGDPGESSYGILVGIVSGGTPRLGKAGISFYARTSSYAAYIDRNQATQILIYSEYTLHSLQMSISIFLISRLCLL